MSYLRKHAEDLSFMLLARIPMEWSAEYILSIFCAVKKMLRINLIYLLTQTSMCTNINRVLAQYDYL